MNRAFRISELLYVFIAAVAAYEVYDLWGTFDSRFWIFVGFMVAAILMFFFRRKQRQKFEERNKNS